MKKWFVGILLSVLLLNACGQEKAEVTEEIRVNDTKVQYVQSDYLNLPNENFYRNDELRISSIERNPEGKPAVYLLETGLDSEEELYAMIYEYSLNEKGEWIEKIIGQESLSKRYQKVGDSSFKMPYILRGDDGNLYALLQVGTALSDDERDLTYEYFVLQINEDADEFYEVPLQLSAADGSAKDYTQDRISTFHILEDGTPLLVFNGGTLIRFDMDSGDQISVSSSVPDNALMKNVGFGENQLFYYSSSEKLLGKLDLDTMEVLGHFGDNIEEDYRAKNWFFDINMDNWKMYAFNTSGIYRIVESGKKAAISSLSIDGAFTALENDITIFDVLVDEKENVYLLVREEDKEESFGFHKSYHFGIYKYSSEAAK